MSIPPWATFCHVRRLGGKTSLQAGPFGGTIAGDTNSKEAIMGNMEQVGHTLENFAARCHDFIKAEPGPAGRRKVCDLLSQVLADEQFVAKYVDSNSKERNILYEDPEFGFCI